MANLDKELDELETKRIEERRKSDALESEIDSEAEATKAPVNKPDHASDGGVI